jgi:uncharacterized protein YPO0396
MRSRRIVDEINDLQRAFYELEKIKQQVNLLSDFLLSKLRDQVGNESKSDELIDPRTGQKFGNKN